MAAREEFDFSADEENIDDEWKFDENYDISKCINGNTVPLSVESDRSVTNFKNDIKTVSETSASERKMSRMDLNTTKAGMEGLDKEKINQIIHEASKGSRFYENEKKKEKQVQKRIEELQRKMVSLSDEQKRKAKQSADKIVQELEQGRDLTRTIVHIDMDAFYAAVEMRDDPSLKSKPMAVGDTAMLCTSNYLARRYGVRAAMPGFIAKKLCPTLTIVPTNFDKYTKISHEIREVLAEYDRNFLPMSLDEAYLDITEYLVEKSRVKNGEEIELKEQGTAKSKVKDESTLEHEAGRCESTKETISVKTNEYDKQGKDINENDAWPVIVKKEAYKSEPACRCAENNSAEMNIEDLERNELVKNEEVVQRRSIIKADGIRDMDQVSEEDRGIEHSEKSSGPRKRDDTLKEAMSNGGEETKKQLKRNRAMELKKYEAQRMIIKKDDDPENIDKSAEAVKTEVQRIKIERDPARDLYASDSDTSPLEEPSDDREMFYNKVEKVVKEIRRKIEERTQLTASAGIAANMFLAKVCSDKNKPNGQFYLKPEKKEIMDFVRELPLRKAFGIGRVSEQILTSVLKVNTCYELYDRRDLMQLLFTPTACRNYLEISLGLGSTVVDLDRERKSISTETTFREINKPEEHFAKCRELCKELSDSLMAKGLRARKIGIKLKTINFEVKTRVCTSSYPVQGSEQIFSHAKKLLVNEIRACSPEPLRLRLMGVRAAEFCDKVNERKQPTITSMVKKGESVPGRPQNFAGSSKAYTTEDAVGMKFDSVGGIDEARSKDVMAAEYHPNTSIKDDQSSLFQREDHKQDGNIKMEELSSFNKNVSTKEPNILNCPVCGKDQTFTSGNVLLQFNLHIDKCLNKQEKSNFGKQTDKGKPTSKKRKRESPDRTAKRRPMDRFLTKHTK